MAFMKSDEILSVGIMEIDEQHQRLISIVNDIYEEIKTCETIDDEKALTGRFIKELQEYARIHFASEELVLEKNEYPEASQHQQEHGAFVDELERIYTSHVSGELALSFDVFSFARDWIVRHVNGSDQEYIPYLN